MNLLEIVQAIENGECVKWKSSNYHVIRDNLNQLLVVCQSNMYTTKLTENDLDNCFV